MEGVVEEEEEDDDDEELDSGISSQLEEESTDLFEQDFVELFEAAFIDLSLITTNGLCMRLAFCGVGGVAAGVIGIVSKSDGEFGAMGARCFLIDENEEFDEFI